MRTKTAIEHAVSTPSINPDAVYTLESARMIFSPPLAKHTLRREIRLGRLRVSKRGGRYFILGAWLLEWLKGGEVRRYRAHAEAEGLAVVG
jgi:hypothetical protein